MMKTTFYTQRATVRPVLALADYKSAVTIAERQWADADADYNNAKADGADADTLWTLGLAVHNAKLKMIEAQERHDDARRYYDE